MNTIPYVYEVADTINGKRYIGCRYARGCAPKDLGISYFTSRDEVASLWRDNPDRFIAKVLLIGSVDYVREMEHRLILKVNAVSSDSFYNRGSRKAIYPNDLIKSGKKTGPIEGAINRELKRGVCGRSPEKMIEDGRKGALVLIERRGEEGTKAHTEYMRSFITETNRELSREALLKECARKTPEERSAMGKKGGVLGGPKACLITNAQIWRCNECGLETKPGPMGKHQSRSNHQGKERIK